MSTNGLKYRKAHSTDDTASESSFSGASPHPSSADLRKTTTTEAQQSKQRESTFQTLQERSAIPVTLYIIYGTIGILHYSAGFYQRETWERWWASMATSGTTLWKMLCYTGNLTQTLWNKDTEEVAPEWQEYARTAVIFVILLSLFYVFVGAPLRAGFWTGRRAMKQHKLHRYAGLIYLAQYTCVWVEYFTDYGAASRSYLPHCIALNGE